MLHHRIRRLSVRYLLAFTARNALLLSILVALCQGGCPFTPPGSDSSFIDALANDTFADATCIELGDDDQIEFTASISNSKDADIFKLGMLAPGDRLYVDVQTVNGNLDPLAAVFDEREYLLAFNDDRTPDASNLNPLIDVTVHGSGGEYFLGIAPFPGTSTIGAYRVFVRVTRGVGIPQPEPQIVYLNWQGGQNILVENVGFFDIEPFEAGMLGPYEGQTDQMKDAIEAEIADRFEGFNLILLSSDDDAEPTDRHSTIYFGGNNRDAFAIAQQIDPLNAEPDDDAIIFVDGFRDAFSYQPTLQQMATAIGNTVAHEIGHLLGLVHTKDCTSLMDTGCGNDALLFEQVFKLAPLDESVFPIGLQNALELIEWAIGLAGL